MILILNVYAIKVTSADVINTNHAMLSIMPTIKGFMSLDMGIPNMKTLI